MTRDHKVDVDRARRLAKSFHEQGCHHHVTGNPDDAEQAFRIAVALRPDHTPYRLELAHAMLVSAKQMTPERLWILRRHLAHAWVCDGENAQTRYCLALYWKTFGVVTRYRQELEEALFYNPDHPQAARELRELRVG